MSTTKLSPAQLVEAVGQLTVLEAAEFVKLAEEKFGVKAAAAAPAAAAGGHAPAAGGAAADHNEGEEALARFLRLRRLGILESGENATADRRGIIDLLEPRGDALPFVVAEIGVPCAGCHDQIVVAYRSAVAEAHLARGGVDGRGLGELDLGVALSP